MRPRGAAKQPWGDGPVGRRLTAVRLPIRPGGAQMCGRYTLTRPIEVLAEEFGITGPLPEVQPSYNVAPGRNVAAVLDGGDGGRRLEVLKWGLVPSWAKDPGIGNRMINARS